MRIRVLNENTDIFEYSHIKNIWKTDIKKIYKITLRNGKNIMCSNDHPIYTKEGYLSINDGLKEGMMIGCNGISINNPKKPYTYKIFFQNSNLFTRKEFAKEKNISYELCKKWGYIHNVEFKIDTNKDFKKNSIPWNKNRKGYKIDIKGRKHNPLKGEKSIFWKGGVTAERNNIGTWTTNISGKVHKKYKYTCQNCGNNKSCLHAHHIIPVVQDISKAYDFNNLITVCKKCHSLIHKSLKSEQEFAEKILNTNLIFEYDKRLNRKVNNLKQVHFSDIISIEYIKQEECYDIEIEGEYKNFVANGIVTHNSARYKELKEDKFYLPEDWNIKMNETPDKTWIEMLEIYTGMGNRLYHQCLQDLTPVLGRKRAKESARYFKTYNSMITSDVMFNFRSFVNFQRLRNDDHAQHEIHDIARQMLQLTKEIPDNPFEHTLKAFNL